MSAKKEKPVMHNGEYMTMTSGAKKIVNESKAQTLADRIAKRTIGLINPQGHVRDDGTHYTIFVKGGIHG